MEQKKENGEKQAQQPESKTDQEKQNANSQEKLLTGLAGAAAGALLTYLFMEGKCKNNKETPDGTGERENEEGREKVRRRISRVLK